MLQDIKEYQADKDKKSVSLNEAERLADQAKQDEKALARANERLTRLGKPTVKSLDELPTDFEAPDEYQIEAGEHHGGSGEAQQGLRIQGASA